MKWFWNRCDRHRQSLSLLVSGALPESERIEIERHLADCPSCRNYFEQLKSVTVALTEYRSSVASLEPTQTARERWARAIRGTSPASGSGQRELAQTWGQWWQELCWPYRHSWGVIAALWVVMWVVNWERPTAHNTQASSTMALSFIEERRMLAELIPAAKPEPADAPRRKPGPRSEWQRPVAIV